MAVHKHTVTDGITSETLTTISAPRSRSELREDTKAIRAIVEDQTGAACSMVACETLSAHASAHPTDIVLGDLLVFGRHRLLCGDATSAGDVMRLLDGATPVLMATDPPYGVNYAPVWRHRVNPSQRTAVGRVMAIFMRDRLSDEESE